MAAKWTFMVYIAGFNDLSPYAARDLGEMRTVGSTDNVNVCVFVKRLGRRSAHHILVRKDGRDEVRETVGNADSGDPQTLMDFVRWAVEAAPADRYALVVWNHGSGWSTDDLDQLYAEVRINHGDTGVTARELAVRSDQQIARALFSSSVEQVLALPTAGDRAIASDDGTGHSMDTIELGRVLEKTHEQLGGPLDLLGMDACLMSNGEVAYEAADHVRTVVGSEELEPGDGWPYDRILAGLTQNPDMEAADLGRLIVGAYAESYQGREDQWPITQCATSTAGMGAFVDALDGLAGALSAHLGDEVQLGRIMRAQSRSVSFSGQLTDVRSFCRSLQGADVDRDIQQAAGGVLDVLAEGAYVLAEAHLGPKVEECGGVTVYFPNPMAPLSRYYADLRFAERGWDDFLQAYRTALSGG